MPLDRRASRLLNGFCGLFALAAIGGMGYLVKTQNQMAEPSPSDPHLDSLRKTKTQATAAVNRKDFPQAERLYRDAIAAAPRDLTLHHELAMIYLADRKEKEAWAEFCKFAPDKTRALQLEPGNRAWYADLEWHYGDRKDAEDLCRLSDQDDWLRPRPTGLALIARTHMLATEHGTGEPVKHLARAVALDPTSVVAHVGLANQYLEMQRPADTQRELDLAEKLAKPGDGCSSAYLAMILSHVGQKAEAKRYAQRTIDAGATNDCRVATGIAHVYANLGDNAQAVQLIAKAEAGAKDPDADTLCGFASVYARLGNRDRAEKLLDRANKIANPTTKSQVANMRREIGIHDLANGGPNAG